MSGCVEKVIYVNGYAWRDVTEETTASRQLKTIEEIERAGGDPRETEKYDSNT